jgi:hypothetical protein
VHRSSREAVDYGHRRAEYGDASRFASAGDLSQITIGGTIRVGDGLTFEVAFLSAINNSVVSVVASTIVGGEAMSGASYQCRDAIISKNVILPGGDVSYVDNENCRVFGLAPDKVVVDHKLDPIYSELKAVRSELDEKFKTIRSELDEKFKTIRSELHGLEVSRNIIIAVLAVLMVLALVNAFYVWQQHKRRTERGSRGSS